MAMRQGSGVGSPDLIEVMTQGEMTEQLWFVVDKGSVGPQAALAHGFLRFPINRCAKNMQQRIFANGFVQNWGMPQTFS